LFPKRSNSAIITKPTFKNWGFKETTFEEAHGFQIPDRCAKRWLQSRRGVFLTGDSAGFADPLTAEGLTNSIYSGILAGKSIAQQFDQPELAASAYQAALEERLLPELRFSEVMASFFYFMPAARNLLMGRYGQRACEILTDVFTGQTVLSQDLKRSALCKSLG
jgi:flavin-dependent dehydrogenase